jgi:hypothetical protein
MKLGQVEDKFYYAAVSFADDIFLLKAIKNHIARCKCCRNKLKDDSGREPLRSPRPGIDKDVATSDAPGRFVNVTNEEYR